MTECYSCHEEISEEDLPESYPEDRERDLCMACVEDTILGVDATEEVDLMLSDAEAEALDRRSWEAGLPPEAYVRLQLAWGLVTGEVDRRLAEAEEIPLDREAVTETINDALGLGQGGEAGA